MIRIITILKTKIRLNESFNYDYQRKKRQSEIGTQSGERKDDPKEMKTNIRGRRNNRESYEKDRDKYWMESKDN